MSNPDYDDRDMSFRKDSFYRRPLAKGTAALPRSSQDLEPARSEELAKLRSLVDALSEGLVRVSGSPFVSVSGAIADIMLQLSNLLWKPSLVPQPNSGLKFETEEWLEEPSEEEWKSSGGTLHKKEVWSFDEPIIGAQFGYRRQLDRFAEPIYRDPLSGEHYRYLSDALSNPLQVTMEFSPVNFSEKDRRTLEQFIVHLSEVFLNLSTGIIDWRLVKALRRFYVPSRPKSESPKSKHAQHFYKARKIQKGKPNGTKKC